MIRRMLCLICAALMLCSALPAAAEEEMNYSYDFDMAFTLNADSFSRILRSRASGYAALVNRLGLRGSIAWNTGNESMDMNAVLYYTDKPSLTYPFRIYGTKSQLFITSPLINNKELYLNLASLMEFSIKAKNTLGVPLPYVAFLVPYSSEFAFSGMTSAWQKQIGTVKKTGRVAQKKIRKLAELWEKELANSMRLQMWIMALAEGSEAPAVVEAFFSDLPGYALKTVARDKPVSVTVEAGSTVWKNNAGEILFSRQKSDKSVSAVLTLPATEKGYTPFLSWLSQSDGKTGSFSFCASFLRDEDSASSQNDSSAAAGPDCLLDVAVDASGLPRQLPADASFTVSASVAGAVYPHCAFHVQGSTEIDGGFMLSLCKPESDEDTPVEILRCTGTLLPGETDEVPDYRKKSPDNMYNVFSFNEESLADFRNQVIPYLVRSVMSFVEEAPTSACQSFLDDLTDTGLLDMLLN